VPSKTSTNNKLMAASRTQAVKEACVLEAEAVMRKE